MKRKLFLPVLILLSQACSKDDPAPGKDITPTSQICDAPASIDMAGAVNWGTGTAESCTQESLQTLINTGGKITCNCGSAPFTLTLTQTLIIPNKEVVIDGKDLLTISGNNNVRIIRKEPAVNQNAGSLLVLQNMRLANGRVSQQTDNADLGGAAIASRGAWGSLKLFNVTFENNQTTLANNVINPGTNHSINADACGAIHTINYKEMLFVNCIFQSNRGANGGAVGTIGSGMTFINCRFEDNTATGTGGTFDKGGQGGAIYVDGTYQNGVNNKLELCGCQFKNNTAGHQGGGYNVVQYDGQGGSGSIDKCVFENNSSAVAHGGGVVYQDGNLAITNSSFIDNTSGTQGGGLWYSNGVLTLTNSTFSGNKAGTTTSGLGGAVALPGANRNNFTITNCTMAENRAGDFASAIFNGGNLTLTNTLFYNNLVGNSNQGNPYGGAVINKNSDLTIGAGNLQFPAGFTGQFGTEARDYWMNETVLTDDALLQPLADNGGSTPTRAIPSNSPAVGKGTGANTPTTDQRGLNRKTPPDIGSYETQ